MKRQDSPEPLVSRLGLKALKVTRIAGREKIQQPLPLGWRQFRKLPLVFLQLRPPIHRFKPLAIENVMMWPKQKSLELIGRSAESSSEECRSSADHSMRGLQ